MRLLIQLFAIAMLALGSASHAGAEAIGWSRDGDRMKFPSAGITLPVQAGAIAFETAGEFSNQGKWIDTALQYKSADGEIYGTVYAYYPGLAHSGLTAFATEYVISSLSSETRKVAEAVVSAGDVEKAAIRQDYAGYRGKLASSAAFLKLDRWIVKVRVSGPEGRRQDVERAMSLILSDMRFSGLKPRKAAPLSVIACPQGEVKAARLVEEKGVDAAAEALILGATDGTGLTASNDDGTGPVMLAHMNDRFCRADPAGSAGEFALLHALEPAATGELPATDAVALLNDAGEMLEVVRIGKDHRYRVVRYSVGRVALLGAFESRPSDAQIRAIIAGKYLEAQRIRATVDVGPEGNTKINVQIADSSS